MGQLLYHCLKEFNEKYDDMTESLSKLEAERKNPFKD